MNHETKLPTFDEPAAAAPAGNVYTLDMVKDRRKYRNSAGRACAGVTDVTGTLDKPGLLYWAWSLGRDGKTMDEGRKAATSIGTVAHARIEAFVRDMVFDEAAVSTELLHASDPSLEKFIDWYNDNGFELEVAEYPMVSNLLNIGGRQDLRLRRKDEPERRVLVDVKTSKGIYAEMILQLAGYVELAANPHLTELDGGSWDEVPGFEIHECWIARVGKDEPGDIDAVELPVSEIDDARVAFVGMAQNHYALKRVLGRRK